MQRGDGQLKKRTWARQVGGQALETEYGYNARNLLTGIEYSDSTSSVTNEYSRIGQRTRTVDAFGEKVFLYDPGTLVLTNEVVRLGTASPSTWDDQAPRGHPPWRANLW